MWKKILVIVLILGIAGAGGYGTFHFYKENKNQIQQNQMLMAQNAQVQAQLDQIGQLTTVYETIKKTYSGKIIKEEDLVGVSVPVSTLNESSVTNLSDIVGHYYKVDINPGTILSKDMLMDESSEEKPKFNREILLTALPVGTLEGDYIDIRFMLPNGEEYIVFSHKQIMKLYENTITIFVNEEENAILNSVLADMGNYSGYVTAYVTRYLEPGNDTDTVAFYPIQHEMENFVRFNPNIKDVTRCINVTLRDHIDEVLLVYTDGQNTSMSQSFIASMNTQITAAGSARQIWVGERYDDDGNFIPDEVMHASGEGSSATAPASTGAGDGSGVTGTDASYDQQVNDAMNSIETSIEDLEAIQ